jgi:hypothetical protein
MISRLNSSALTGKFLVIAALRGAIAMVIGLAVGETELLTKAVTPNQSHAAYFLVGLFPGWVIGALRRKAKDVFQPPDDGCEALPLCLIDGLDDGIIDRLSEIAILDVQHLSAASPIELAVPTLYPLRRIVDWCDQAILISYVRSKIVYFRNVGLRGAIDFAVLYRDLSVA